jgi:hypothetical protein
MGEVATTTGGACRQKGAAHPQKDWMSRKRACELENRVLSTSRGDGRAVCSSSWASKVILATARFNTRLF